MELNQRRKDKSKDGNVDISGDGGITKQILKEGDGQVVPLGAYVTVHYTGKLEDGSVFDSSKSRNKPFSFVVGGGQVIKGWDQGVKTMTKGESCIMTCKSDYAYGSRGVSVIPPNATLIFEIDLLDWQVAQKDKMPLLYKIVVFFSFGFLIMNIAAKYLYSKSE